MYTKEQILNVLNFYKNKIKIHKNFVYSANLPENISLFNEISKKYPGMFNQFSEILYLFNHDISEKFCIEGNEKKFKNTKKGYSPYCLKMCETCKKKKQKKWGDVIEKKFGTRVLSHTDFMKKKFKDPEWGRMCYEKGMQKYKEKTGYEQPFKNPEVLKKRQKTLLQKTGYKHHWMSPDPKLNGRATCKEIYGVENIFMLPEVKQRAINARKNPEWLKKVLETRDKNKKQIFEKKHNNYDDYTLEFMEKNFIKDGKFDIEACCKYYNLSYHWVLKKKRDFGIITPNVIHILEQQNEIYNFLLKNYKGNILFGDRKILNPLELDLYIPDRKVAIEFNGIYWHSILYKKRMYHQQKSKLCLEKGIRLIHIYEDEWKDDNKKMIIKDIILHALGINKDKRIYARKCEIKEITNEIYKNFCNKNHIQGYKEAKIKLGLFYNNDLVQIASFSKSRYDKQYEWEWIRGCPASNNSVIGGTSKLFKYFINRYNPKSVVCYADFNKFDGKGYKECGFVFDKITAPDKFYFDRKEKIRVNRSPKKYSQYMDNVKKNKFYLLYGAGNLKFTWHPSLKS